MKRLGCCVAAVAAGLFVGGAAEARSPLFDGSPRAVPGHLELEDFNTAPPTVQTRTTPREEAGQGEVVVAANGAVANYAVDVAETGLYEVKIRYSRVSGGTAPKLALRLNERELTRVDLRGTGSADNFQTLTVRDVRLTAGRQTLSLRWTDRNQGNLSGVMNNWVAFRLQASDASPQTEIFVAPGGSGDGSRGNPFGTLQQAVDRVAALKAGNPNAGPIQIWLRAGYHEVTSTIRLNGRHSGTARGPVRVSAFGNERAIIGGGRRVPFASLEPVADAASRDRLKPAARDRVRRARLNDADWQARMPGNRNLGMVSWNGQALQLAQVPNKGLLYAENARADGSFSLEGGIDNARWRREWTRLGDMTVIGHPQADEFEARLAVTSVGSDGRISFGQNLPKFRGNGRKLKVVNVLAELDMPGEWFYDKRAGQFYVWPLTGFDASTDLRVGGQFELIQASDVNFWSFENLYWQDVGGTGDGDGPGNLASFSGDNLYFAGNVFRNANSRVGLRWNGRFIRVTGNDFTDLSAPFVLGGGRRSFPVVPSQSEFTNNLLYRNTNRGYGGGGLSGAGIRFANNLTTDVQSGNTYTNGTDLLLELNEWYDSGYELGDWNVAYVGATYAQWGTVVRNNFVHYIDRPSNRRRAGAFRGDDGTAGLAFVGNVFYRTADYAVAQGRIGATINNNVAVNQLTFHLGGIGPGLIGRVVNTPADVRAEFAAQQAITRETATKSTYLFNAERILGADFWTRPYFAYKYPLAAEAFRTNPFNGTNTQIRRNLTVNVPRRLDGGGPAGTSDAQRLQNSLAVFADAEAPRAENLGIFNDVRTLNLGLRNSFRRPSGFKAISFDRIGLVRGAGRPATPHKDSYRAQARLRWESTPAGAPGRRASRGARDNAVYPDPTFNSRTVYDLGTTTSPLWQNATLLTADTRGAYGFENGTGLRSDDGAPGNNLNRDGIVGNGRKRFAQRVENGDWYVLVTFGGRNVLSGMSLAGNGQAPSAENRDVRTDAGQYVNKTLRVRVTDRWLRFELNGSPWRATRIITQRTPF